MTVPPSAAPKSENGAGSIFIKNAVFRTLSEGLWRALEGSGGLWRSLEGSGVLVRSLEGSEGLCRGLEGTGGL